MNPTICQTLMSKDGKEILLRNWHLNDEESCRGTCSAICANCKDFPGSADQTRRAVIRPPRMGVGKTPLKRSLSWAAKDKSGVTRNRRKEEEEKARQAQSRLVRGRGVGLSLPLEFCVFPSPLLSQVCSQFRSSLAVPHLGSCLLSGFSLWPAWSLVCPWMLPPCRLGVSATYKLGLSWVHIPSGFQSCLVVRYF